jgi:hypothetical protein
MIRIVAGLSRRCIAASSGARGEPHRGGSMSGVMPNLRSITQKVV